MSIIRVFILKVQAHGGGHVRCNRDPLLYSHHENLTTDRMGTRKGRKRNGEQYERGITKEDRLWEG